MYTQFCRTRAAWPALAAAIALSLMPTLSPRSAAQGGRERLLEPGVSKAVNIDNFSFTPQSLTVPVGATVTWTNHDDVPHTVVSTKKVFASPGLDTGERFSFRFTTRGTYPYYCSVHPMMTGTVVVK